MPRVPFKPPKTAFSQSRMESIMLDVSLDDEARYFMSIHHGAGEAAPMADTGPFPPSPPLGGRGGKRGTTREQRDSILAALGLPPVIRDGGV